MLCTIKFYPSSCLHFHAIAMCCLAGKSVTLIRRCAVKPLFPQAAFRPGHFEMENSLFCTNLLPTVCLRISYDLRIDCLLQTGPRSTVNALHVRTTTTLRDLLSDSDVLGLYSKDVVRQLSARLPASRWRDGPSASHRAVPVSRPRSDGQSTDRS